tara:strand:- start:2254 stop:2421 length:168 start_codon:yes stop_codon:yes gene_type:complete
MIKEYLTRENFLYAIKWYLFNRPKTNLFNIEELDEDTINYINDEIIEKKSKKKNF